MWFWDTLRHDNGELSPSQFLAPQYELYCIHVPPSSHGRVSLQSMGLLYPSGGDILSLDFRLSFRGWLSGDHLSVRAISAMHGVVSHLMNTRVDVDEVLWEDGIDYSLRLLSVCYLALVTRADRRPKVRFLLHRSGHRRGYSVK